MAIPENVITRKALVETLYVRLGKEYSRKCIEAILTEFSNELHKQLLIGTGVRLPRIGVIGVTEFKERIVKGYTPGTRHYLPQRNYPRLYPTRQLRKEMAGVDHYPIIGEDIELTEEEENALMGGND